MDNALFETELKNLSLLVKSFDSDELFIESYKELLMKVKDGDDPSTKYNQAKRMKEILMVQTAFMMNEHIRAQRLHGNAIF